MMELEYRRAKEPAFLVVPLGPFGIPAREQSISDVRSGHQCLSRRHQISFVTYPSLNRRAPCAPSPHCCAVHMTATDSSPSPRTRGLLDQNRGTDYAPVKSYPVPGLPEWRYAGAPVLDTEASPASDANRSDSRNSPASPPLPAVVYFALTAEQSLELPPFNQFVRFLLCDGDPEAAFARGPIDDANAPLRVFSVTLPFHGTMADNETALSRWADLYITGADLVSFFTRKASAALDSLVARGIVDPDRVSVAGLSRGGLLAAHFAMRSRYANVVLCFSPVTKLSDLTEFRQAAQEAGGGGATGMPAVGAAKVEQASLLHWKNVEALAPCTVRVYCGNADTRVGTRNCFDLMAALTDCAGANRVRSPPHEFIMYCSLGRDGHGTSPDVFAVGARWLLRRAGLRR